MALTQKIIECNLLKSNNFEEFILTEAEEIAKAVVAALEDTRSIDCKTHNEHHKYIRLQIDREIKRNDILDQIKLHLMKYGALGLTSVLFFAAWQYFKASIHG